MSRIALVELDDHVVSRAAALQPPELRTIDAIHLARSSPLERISERSATMTKAVEFAFGDEPGAGE
jgi:hypothetical protein